MRSFITTPIYYVNDIPHIGHAYTTFLADMLHRYHKLRGYQTLFLTGTDEHGLKIQQSAQYHGKEPKEYVDLISRKFRELWDHFEVEYTDFTRTSDPEHKLSVQKAFEIMQANGDIYKGEYEGHYCISCESYFTPRQIHIKNQCPDCNKPMKIIKEESYFFRLSKYQDTLLSWLQNHNCIYPVFRKNEVINFIKAGLNDLSITRTSFEWGIPLPKTTLTNRGDEKHVIYVWLDALLSYLSPLGWGNNLKDRMDFWSHAHQFIGKDILRFHAVYWPAFLTSLGLPLPKRLYTHGWWLIENVKMSKSLGNVINPKEIVDKFGRDALSYFLMREVSFGQDGDFSQKALIERINTDLANDLGNLLSRSLSMAEKYFELKVHALKEDLEPFWEDLTKVHEKLDSLNSFIQSMQPSKYLEILWEVFTLANILIAKHQPWELIKNNQSQKAQSLLVVIFNILSKGSLVLYPIMPKKSQEIAYALGLTLSSELYERLLCNKEILLHFQVSKSFILFPKIDPKDFNSQLPLEEKDQTQSKEPISTNSPALVGISDFQKIQIQIASIKQANPIPKSKKLLKLILDAGDREYQVVSGIAEFYSAESLINKQICFISNLEPVRLMGELSEGMILATRDKNGLKLICPDGNTQNGSAVK